MSGSTAVVIGGGLAGAKAVEAMRASGYDGAIIVMSAESEPPYERPPLSKGFLTGASPLEDARVLPKVWYGDHDVDLRLSSRVRQLDLAAQEVQVEGVAPTRFDQLLLATGSEPRRLDVPGAADADLLYLRTASDSRRLREQIEQGRSDVVVVGGGWIGLEVAAAARGYGNEVTVLEPQPTPLFGPLGPELGRVFADKHRAEGVEMLTGTGVAAIERSGAATVVVDDAGGRHSADVVVVGVGISPSTELAVGAGLDVGRGVLTDAALRSSHPAVWAAGDVAEFESPLYGKRIHVEHWANALNGGTTAGESMAGREVVHDRVPYFFTDQYDLGMEFSGLVTPGGYDRVVYRGDPESLEFVAFWLSDGRVVAGMNVNVWDVTDDIQHLVRAGEPVDVDRLTDTDVPLSEV